VKQEKEEEEEEEDDVPLGKMVKKEKKRVVVESDGDEDDDVPLSKMVGTASVKKEVKREGESEKKKKKVSSATKNSGAAAGSGSRGKSVESKDKKKGTAIATKSEKYELPGQRTAVPPVSDPLRLFYQSMYEEKKRKGEINPLAADWVVSHGLLEGHEALSVLAKISKN